MNDLISRQAAIDALDVLCQEHRYKIPGKVETYSQYNEAWQDALDRAEGAIGNLPSTQPELSNVAVNAMAVEEMLKDLLPERGMWEIEGDEAKTAICEVVRDALEGLWKLPFVKPNSKESSLTQKALDTISRQAAIDVIDAGHLVNPNEPRWSDNEVVNFLKSRPSAQPERTGKWIKEKSRGQLYQCSACGNYLDFRGVNAGRGSANFCPNCGARMERRTDG